MYIGGRSVIVLQDKMKDSDIYQRGGCQFYSDCLTCPFPLIGDECLFDAQDSVMSKLREAEARKLARHGEVSE